MAGLGNHNTAEFWEYDTRLGRRWNVDPVLKDWESPYLCFSGNPILINDKNGDDGKTAAAILVATQEAAGATTASVIGAPAAPFIEVFGDALALYEWLKDVPAQIPVTPKPLTPPATQQPAVRKADSKDVEKKAPAANDGAAKQHGGKEHNEAIDNHVAKAKKEGATNVRKNQQQVDVNGNKAGKNRPDIQYDKDGKHTNVEYDNLPKNSAKHGETIKNNDPDANVELNVLPKK